MTSTPPPPETGADLDRLIRQFIAGVAAHAASTSEPALLVAAALIDPAASGLLDRASAAARTTRDRQLVAIAAAHLDGDADRVDALAREHLADHPDHVLVAWIAATSRTETKEIR
jgi:hypothetical protein